MNRPLLLLNPRAGSIRDDPRLLTTLQAHPSLRGTDLVPTDGPDHLRALAQEAREEGRPGLMVGGGDGTIHSAVNGLLGGLDPDTLPSRDRLPSLAVLPLGTGNDLARSLGLPSDIRKALDALDWERVRSMDLMWVEGAGDPWCLNVVTGGLATPDSDEPGGDEKKAPGVLAYWRRGVDALADDQPAYRLTLDLEGEERLELSAQNVVVANGRFVAGGIPVAPEAYLNDGLLDLLAVPDLDLGQMALLFPRLLAGKHGDHPQIVSKRTRRVDLRSEPDLDLSLDGEGGRAGNLTLEAVPGALNVVAGPDPSSWAFRES